MFDCVQDRGIHDLITIKDKVVLVVGQAALAPSPGGAECLCQ